MTRLAPEVIDLAAPEGAVPVRCFTGEALRPGEDAARQLRRLAALPGVVGHVAVLPDVHVKHRNPTPTGTVAVTRDVLVPRAIDGGVNCGLRTMVTQVPARDLSAAHLDALFGRLIEAIPLKRHERPLIEADAVEDVLVNGLERLAAHLDLPGDELAATEGRGRALPDAPAESIRAAIPRKKLVKDAASLGTIGAGNHFLELQEAEEILDPQGAAALGVERGAALFTLHCDGRRLSKKITKPLFEEAAESFGPLDSALWAVPADSDWGRRFLGAFAAAYHAGYANRAMVTHLLRGILRDVLGDQALSLRLLFDCGHESVRRERHGGEMLWVHRHGASHADPPGAPGASAPPVATVAGSMGTCSYLCAARSGVARTYHSIAHGAGRVMEKADAALAYEAGSVEAGMSRRGIRLYRYHADEIGGQAPESFKDVEQVVAAMECCDLVTPIARLRPVAVLKG